jgi:hypothetical protein
MNDFIINLERLSWADTVQDAQITGKKAEDGRLVLDYKVRMYGGDWEPIKQSIRITYADCHYGGQRPYFRCPGVVNGHHCGRRVGKLFAGGKYFLCRHCYKIAYGSQSEARCDRMLRRANKLRMALGGEPGTAHWIAHKPKGMWQRTYQRKRFEINWCENWMKQRWSRNFGPIVKVDRMKKVTIQNEETKEPFTRFQSQGCA